MDLDEPLTIGLPSRLLPGELGDLHISPRAQERARLALQVLDEVHPAHERVTVSNYYAIIASDTVSIVLTSPKDGRGCSRRKPQRWFTHARDILQRIASGTMGGFVFFEIEEAFIARRGATDFHVEVWDR